MIVVGRRLLIEQTMIKKKSLIITPGKKDEEQFDTTFKIIQIGQDCPDQKGLKIGAVPIFDKHVTFNGAKVLLKTPEKTVLHTIVFYDDLIGFDD